MSVTEKSQLSVKQQDKELPDAGLAKQPKEVLSNTGGKPIIQEVKEADGDKDQETVRIRSLTEKGKEQYVETRDALLQKVNHPRDKIDELLDSQVVNKEHLYDALREYECESQNYLEFLSRFRSEESVEDKQHFLSMYHLRVSRCQTVLNVLNDHAQSVASSRKTASSSTSSATRRRAKAEAARAKLLFAQKELELQKKKALLEEENKIAQARNERLKQECEAELRVLSDEKEAAAADAEANFLEAAEENSAARSRRSISPNSKLKRTQEYVQNLHTWETRQNDTAPLQSGDTDNKPDEKRQPDTTSVHPRFNLSAQAKAFDPHLNHHAAPKTSADASDLSRFLLKKELMLSRLTPFNEKPESFAVWQNSFRAIMLDLDATPQEELDLLVKYLGPETSRYALSLRASNAANPERGLRTLWERLEERYGSPEIVEACLKARLQQFPQLTYKDGKKLYELCDLLDEIQSALENPALSPLFAIYNSSTGVNAVMNKLPRGIQQRWITQAFKYKTVHSVPFPPFSYLVDFVRTQSKILNDPAFNFQSEPVKPHEQRNPRNQQAFARKTDIDQNEDKPHEPPDKCPIHKSQHTLATCNAFKAKSWNDRVALLKEKKICYKCLSSTKHIAKKCPATVSCEKCNKPDHCTAMHRGERRESQAPSDHGGEGRRDNNVENKCTTLCDSINANRSCGKIVQVRIYSAEASTRPTTVYAVIDDQSNRSLASPALLDRLGVDPEEYSYTLTSCSGTYPMTGRRGQNLTVQSLDGQTTLKLPTVIECDNIPDNRSEIPTDDVAKCHSHLHSIVGQIPPLRSDVPISLLIGRDLPEAHHVLDQVTGPPMSPFAQRLPLGWVIVGDVCLDGIHKPSSVRVIKTHVLHGSRESLFEPCQNNLKIAEADQLGTKVFERTKDDEIAGTSVEDRKFLDVMDSSFRKNDQGRWSAPLPFRNSEPIKFNNRRQAVHRANTLHASMKRNLTKREHMFEFMKKIFETGSAEKAPPLEGDSRCWYLPFFGVYHPKKPDKIRGVFDSSAVYEGHSLNSMLLSGPDLTNNLIGILLRFRRDSCAVSVDIEQMFYQFFVDENHRDYLRFFWYEDNDFHKPLTEFRMCVHVFGNSPSPAVASYGLRKTVASSDKDVKDFVGSDFYVDDGVTSLPESERVVSLIKLTQTELKEKGRIRLHKVASNDIEVLKAFPAEDLCTELKSVDLSDSSQLPQHSCLGIPWNLKNDTLSVALDFEDTADTRRGILSTLGRLYDPLGFIAPATIAGKIILRELCPDGRAWDEPLSAAQMEKWKLWKRSLETLQGVDIPRMYLPASLTQSSDVEFHVFCDSSEKAIASVAYVKAKDSQNSPIGFVMGKAKVAPQSGHTIPRLELCSAVLATELWQLISKHLVVDLKKVSFYTDSKVVLGYINNETRRFYTYVSNRVERIRHVSEPSQWHFVPSESNPADVATRCALEDFNGNEETWLRGPADFLENQKPLAAPAVIFPMVVPDEDCEVRPVVRRTEVKDVHPPLSSRFEKFSSWNALVSSLTMLRHLCQSFHFPTDCCKGWHQCSRYHHHVALIATETFIIKTVQHETFAAEIQCLRKGSALPKTSPVASLSPVLDEEGLLRVGGRLDRAKDTVGLQSAHPVILPRKHHVSNLLVQHYHKKVKHQGRHFTEGALRSNGFWIVGAKRLVASVIHQCFQCRRLRGKPAHQHMASLPADRVTPSGPFSHVGVDVFGPWSIVARKTRGGLASAKRWAVVFVCMAIRAIHIEVIEDMSSSSFVNALRRFIALRGPVTELRSDRGTNFVGAAGELGINSEFVEDVNKHLTQSRITWKFNPPHASHMGGSWERMIGTVRRILDSMLQDQRRKALTHEILCTLMAEVCAIVNARPITPISHDPDSPFVLTPSMLLNLKCERDQVPLDSVDIKDIYKSQWRHVQHLSKRVLKTLEGRVFAIIATEKEMAKRANERGGGKSCSSSGPRDPQE
ncbi:uncharacterized protein [Littorina saxatilis]|uniref:uncharacterized protein n=1 Tax=Littorina saxatilis TaxID=31220 RepID=UPI0038B5B31D